MPATSSSTRAIGLFGGSFDPIHHGHLIAGQAAAERLGLDELRYMPAREQPFKRGLHAAPASQAARSLAPSLAATAAKPSSE